MDKLVQELFEEHKSGEQLDANDIAYLFAYIRDHNADWVDGPESADMLLVNEVQRQYDRGLMKPIDLQAKHWHKRAGFLLDAIKTMNLCSLAVEFDHADDDADWRPPHPIFRMAEEIDNLRAIVRAIRAVKPVTLYQHKTKELDHCLAVRWDKFCEALSSTSKYLVGENNDSP